MHHGGGVEVGAWRAVRPAAWMLCEVWNLYRHSTVGPPGLKSGGHFSSLSHLCGDVVLVLTLRVGSWSSHGVRHGDGGVAAVPGHALRSSAHQGAVVTARVHLLGQRIYPRLGIRVSGRGRCRIAGQIHRDHPVEVLLAGVRVGVKAPGR